MKDPFTLESAHRHDIRHRALPEYSRDRHIGDDAHWLLPSKGAARPTTEQRRISWLFVLVIFSFVVIATKAWNIQIMQGAQYREWAEDNRIRIRDIVPPRGLILDRYENKLATNSANFQLTITPGDLPQNTEERSRLFETLSNLLGMPVDDITRRVEEATDFPLEPVVIADHLPHEQSVTLEIQTKPLPGVEVTVASAREYSNNTAYAHVIGYTGKLTREEFDQRSSEPSRYLFSDVIGKTGIESMYEEALRGTLGKREVEVDAAGHQQKVIAESPPIPGKTILLTLDGALQVILAEELDKALRQHPQAEGAAAVALDPRNGDVLALASSPSFSSTEFSQGLAASDFSKLLNDPRKPLFFRPIAGEYPSGSVIKPVIAAAGLQENVITASTTFLSTGGIRIGSWFFPDWKPGGHGVTNVVNALAESVNTFFYYTGGGDNETFTGLGVDRIRQYAEYFGLNHPLGIDLPGEASGFLPTKEWKLQEKREPWYIGDTYHLAIGQGDLLVTPLQVATYTSAIANGGTVYRPHLLKETRSYDDLVKTPAEPHILKSGFISTQNIRTVQQGMREGVLSGSSQALASLPFSSAAKTGTAQFGLEGRTHAWFTAFAPYENPEIVLTVLIEGGGEGHDAALPVAKAALDWWARNRR